MIIRHVDVTWRQSTERHLYIIDYCPGIGKEERRAGAYCVVLWVLVLSWMRVAPRACLHTYLHGWLHDVFLVLATEPQLNAWALFVIRKKRVREEKSTWGTPKEMIVTGLITWKTTTPRNMSRRDPLSKATGVPHARFVDRIRKAAISGCSQQLQIDRLILPLSGIIASYIFLSASHERPSSSKVPSSIEMESSDPRRGWNRKERSKRDR